MLLPPRLFSYFAMCKIEQLTKSFVNVGSVSLFQFPHFNTQIAGPSNISSLALASYTTKDG